MIQILAATFEDGVFKPDQRPVLPENTRVRLHVETINVVTEDSIQQNAWASLEEIWQNSTFNSSGDRLTRDQLHERR